MAVPAALAQVLTLHGSADDTVPAKNAEEFARHIRNHTLKVVDGADHGFSQHKDIAVETAAAFLLEGMPAAA